jgi:predicted lipid-binding transport protein (Tim44 family)
MMSNLIIIALLAFAVIWVLRLLARRRAPAEPAYARQAASGSAFEAPPASGSWAAREAAPEPAGSSFAAGSAAAAASASHAPGVPADFDSEAFLRSAKVHFIRMQASWDAGNLADIREFTTPEMFGEIQVDLGERGAATNLTDVVKLDAELLGVEERADEYLASVRFHGLMREAPDATAAPFQEIWNLSKPTQQGGGWLLAGIQQIN